MEGRELEVKNLISSSNTHTRRMGAFNANEPESWNTHIFPLPNLAEEGNVKVPALHRLNKIININ